MSRYLPFIIVGTVAFLTLAGATALYQAKRPVVLTIPVNETTSLTRDSESTHLRGNPKAPVTLEEFGDFECPPCGNIAGAILQLEKDYQPNLRVIFRHFPLIVHAHAREAALAAEAAGLQGRFWEMHDLLYREQSVWSKATNVRTVFNAYAGILGLDIERFKRDMDGDKVKARVALDQKQAVAIGVQNTPTFFLNNRALEPSKVNPDGLRAAIDAAVKVKASPASQSLNAKP
jgi:NhaA family Na+:H+ antiporter